MIPALSAARPVKPLSTMLVGGQWRSSAPVSPVDSLRHGPALRALDHLLTADSMLGVIMFVRLVRMFARAEPVCGRASLLQLLAVLRRAANACTRTGSGERRVKRSSYARSYRRGSGVALTAAASIEATEETV